jgi:hypothetical protein
LPPLPVAPLSGLFEGAPDPALLAQPTLASIAAKIAQAASVETKANETVLLPLSISSTLGPGARSCQATRQQATDFCPLFSPPN